MKKVLAILAVVAMLGAVPSAALAVGLVNVTSFNPLTNEIPDGLAVGPDSNLYISMPVTNEIRQVNAAGEAKTVAIVPDGPLNGMAFSTNGRFLYVLVASGNVATHGIWRVDITSGESTRFVSLATSILPSGLVFRGEDLFFTERARGNVHRVKANREMKIWATNTLLQGRGSSERINGSNGLAFTKARWPGGAAARSGGTAVLQEYLYVANPAFGRIVRIPVQADGEAEQGGSTAETFFQGSVIEGAAGIGFDDGSYGGTLFVAVNTQHRIVALSAAPNSLARIVIQGNGLQSPSGLVHFHGVLYVNNTGLGTTDSSPSLLKVTDYPLPLFPEV